MVSDINMILNELFMLTGNIGFKLLENAILNPELDKMIDDESLEK